MAVNTSCPKPVKEIPGDLNHFILEKTGILLNFSVLTIFIFQSSPNYE